MLAELADELDEPTYKVSAIFPQQPEEELAIIAQKPAGEYSRRSCIRTALTMSSSIPTHPLNFTLLPTPIVAPFPDRSVAPTPTISRCRRRRVPPLSHRHSVLCHIYQLAIINVAHFTVMNFVVVTVLPVSVTHFSPIVAPFPTLLVSPSLRHLIVARGSVVDSPIP
jgi:hypothetical protein